MGMVRLNCVGKLQCIWAFIRCLKKCARHMRWPNAFDECMFFCGCIFLHPLRKWSCDDYRLGDIEGC